MNRSTPRWSIPRQLAISGLALGLLCAPAAAHAKSDKAGSAKAASAASPAKKAGTASAAKKAPPASAAKKAAPPAAAAKARPKAAGKTQTQPSKTRAPAKKAGRPQVPDTIRQLGPLSVGHPHEGFLVNAVKMPSSPLWRVTVPSHGYGTQETVDGLSHCIARVHEQIPDSPPVNLGSLSAEHGGLLPPHKSHRSGRDVDVYFFRLPGTEPWLGAATRDDIDLPRTWALLKCFITDTDTDMILIDQVPQKWLRDYAASIGEPSEWLQDVFDDKGGYKSALVRHVPGHVAHMHVRFVSPKARRAGKDNYERLVQLGLLDLPEKALVHTVAKGDTLGGLAQRFKLGVKQIQSLNQLKSTMIRVGQKLTLRQRVDLRGVRDPIWVPPRRRLPEGSESPSAKVLTATTPNTSSPGPSQAAPRVRSPNTPPGPPVSRNES